MTENTEYYLLNMRIEAINEKLLLIEDKLDQLHDSIHGRQDWTFEDKTL
jgi:uncharacterized Rmd1/YagE family protein